MFLPVCRDTDIVLVLSFVDLLGNTVEAGRLLSPPEELLHGLESEMRTPLVEVEMYDAPLVWPTALRGKLVSPSELLFFIFPKYSRDELRAGILLLDTL